MNKQKLLLASAVAAALVAPGANAATSTTTFSVGATVSDSCSVTAGDLSFGTIDPLVNVTTASDATSTIDVTCANGTAYDVGLDAGGSTGATTAARAMTGGTGTDLLNYSLYSDSGRTTNWGDVVDTDTVAGTGSGTAQTLTVYGRIPTGQNTAPTGSYSDTITVTVTY